MERCLRSALVVAVLMLFSVPLFVTNSWAEGQQNQTQVAKSPEESQIEQLKQEIEAIQNQNQKQIEELRKKIDELESKKATKEPEKEKFLSNFDAGYKDGLFLKTRDDKFSLKFNALFQGQFFIQTFDDKRGTTPSDEQITFQIRRLRLFFSGNGFYPWVKYYIQIGADRGSNFEIKDAYLDFAYYPELTPRIGQWKVPFQREELTSDAFLEFGADRSIVNDEFTLERDLGVELYGSLFNNLIEYAGGVFNGAGRNVSPNPNGPNLLYAGRVVFEPLGKYEYSQGDLRDDPSTPLLAIGAAVAELPNFNPITENTAGRANLAKTILAIDKNITNADVFQFTADVAFKYYGFAFEGEYDLRRIYHIQSTAAINDATRGQGLRLQAGYLLLPPHFEVAFRYGIVDANNHLDRDRKQEFTPALNYYIYKHRLKVGVNYTLIVQQNPSGGNFKDNRFKLDAQLFF
jgi:phosphate-selective porin OprO/OprP